MALLTTATRKKWFKYLGLGEYNKANILFEELIGYKRFLIEIIKPKYSLISVGNENKFGHPNQEVLNNLKTGMINLVDMVKLFGYFDCNIFFILHQGK